MIECVVSAGTYNQGNDLWVRQKENRVGRNRLVSFPVVTNKRKGGTRWKPTTFSELQCTHS